MTTKCEYNGWWNRETWLANLHFDGVFQDDAERCLSEAIDYAGAAETADIRTAATSELADLIQAYIEEACEPQDGGHLFVQEAINGVLREIEYSEIAANYLRDLPIYIVGWNMPGYMPDMQPQVFGDFDLARDYVTDTMKDAAEDDPAIACDVDAAKDRLAAIKTSGFDGKDEWSETVGSYHYSITREG